MGPGNRALLGRESSVATFSAILQCNMKTLNTQNKNTEHAVQYVVYRAAEDALPKTLPKIQNRFGYVCYSYDIVHKILVVVLHSCFYRPNSRACLGNVLQRALRESL